MNTKKGIRNNMLISLFHFVMLSISSTVSFFLTYIIFRVLENKFVESLSTSLQNDYSYIAKFYTNEILVIIASAVVLFLLIFCSSVLVNMIILKFCKVYEQNAKTIKLSVVIFQLVFAIIFSIFSMNIINNTLTTLLRDRADYFQEQITTYEDTLDTLENNIFSSLYSFPDNFTLENLQKGKGICETGVSIIYILIVLFFVENLALILLSVMKINKSILPNPVDEDGNVVYFDKKRDLKISIICGMSILTLIVSFFILRNIISPFVTIENSDDSSVFSSHKYSQDNCTDVEKILRAKEITDNLKVGDMQSEIEKKLGDLQYRTGSYFYTLCGHRYGYYEDLYSMFFSGSKLKNLYVAGITTSPKDVAEILDSKIGDIDIESKKIKRGMNFKKVKEILGEAYILSSMSEYYTGYIWLDTNGDYIEVLFENDKALRLIHYN